MGNLSELGFTDFDTVDITFELVNRFGKKVSLQNETNFNLTSRSNFSTTTNSYGDFNCELLENSNINRQTYYKCTIGSNEPFNFFLPKGNSEEVNILCLTNEIDYDGVLTIKESITGDVYIFEESFIKKFDQYLLGKNPHLTRAEEKLIDKYSALINIPIDQRCSDIAELDKYLATIGAE